MAGIVGPTSDRTRHRDRRGQSDVVAIVLLFGMVFVGAGIVLLAGGMLVDGVQDESEHELARDSALQTHNQLQRAMTSQSPQELPGETGAVDRRVVEGGHLSVEMYNSTGATCSRVGTDLGAVVYESERGRLVYEGGALWEETDAGLTVEQAPPISYDEDAARISLQVVTADANQSLRSGTAVPDEELQSQLQTDVREMLVRCPGEGATNLRITVQSEYHDAWADHFEARVDTSPNVTVTHDESAETVEATIANATSAHPSRGLRFQDVDAPTVVGPGGAGPAGPGYPNQFTLTADVANDGFVERDATVRVELAGTETYNLSMGTLSAGENRSGVAVDETYGHLTSPAQLDLSTGEVHNYTVELLDGDDDVVSESSGRFFLAEPGGGDVSLWGADHEFTDGGDTVVVSGTLVNTMPTNATGETVAFEIVDGATMSPVDRSIDVPGYGGTRGASFAVNVSGFQAGPYRYEVRHLASNGSVLESEDGTFWVPSSPGSSGALVEDLRVERIDPSDQYLETGDAFGVDVGLFNTANATASADVSLDVGASGNGLDDDATVTVSGGDGTNVTLAVDGDDVERELETRREHEYTVSVEENGTTVERTGSFVLLESGTALRIEDATVEQEGDDVEINATLANHGVDPGTSTAELALYDNSSGDLVGVTDAGPTTLNRSEALVQPYGFNASQLSGVYDYRITFGGDQVEGTVDFGGVEGGDGSVSIDAPGNGTVTVLGTEVSGESTSEPWIKQWAPVGAGVSMERDGVETRHNFTNDGRTSVGLENERNLNTYDTQTDEYVWEWEQDPGESVNLTVSATLWEREERQPGGCSYAYDGGTDHTRNGPGYDERRTYEDRHPTEEYYEDEYRWGSLVCDAYAYTVDASQGENPTNVRVLTDGDELPDVTRGFPDQRNASQVLNDGAAHRIDPDTGELQLNPNEAVFLFELTDPNATWSEAQSAPPNQDPTYNDVIALVEFTPYGNQSVTFDVADGNTLSITATSPDVDDASDPAVGSVSADETAGESGEPATPTPQDPDPGAPTEPDEIDVDVGTVVVG